MKMPGMIDPGRFLSTMGSANSRPCRATCDAEVGRAPGATAKLPEFKSTSRIGIQQIAQDGVERGVLYDLVPDRGAQRIARSARLGCFAGPSRNLLRWIDRAFACQRLAVFLPCPADQLRIHDTAQDQDPILLPAFAQGIVITDKRRAVGKGATLFILILQKSGQALSASPVLLPAVRSDPSTDDCKRQPASSENAAAESCLRTRALRRRNRRRAASANFGRIA